MNLIGWWIHSICSSNRVELSRLETLGLGPTVKLTFILAIVINKEIVKTKTSFLVFKAISIWIHIAFLVIVPADHLAQFFFGPIHIAVPTVVVRGINDINFEDWSRVFGSLFLDMVVAILHLFFSDFLNGFFSILKSCRPSFLVSKLRLFNSKIFHKSYLIASFIIFYKLFVMSNALVYFSKYWES